MTILNNAPKLYNNRVLPEKNFGIMANDIKAYCFAALTYNEFKLFDLLQGTNEFIDSEHTKRFDISELFIANRTGIDDSSTISKIRAELIDKGFIDYTQYEKYVIRWDNINKIVAEFKANGKVYKQKERKQREYEFKPTKRNKMRKKEDWFDADDIPKPDEFPIPDKKPTLVNSSGTEADNLSGIGADESSGTQAGKSSDKIYNGLNNVREQAIDKCGADAPSAPAKAGAKKSVSPSDAEYRKRIVILINRELNFSTPMSEKNEHKFIEEITTEMQISNKLLYELYVSEFHEIANHRANAGNPFRIHKVFKEKVKEAIA